MHKNLLLNHMPIIETHEDIIRLLDTYPLQRKEVIKHPVHIRASMFVEGIEKLFVTMPIHIQSTYMVNDMLTQYYSNIDPASPEHIRRYYGENPSRPAIAGMIEGFTGTGKTKYISRLLSNYPQIITHERFPHFTGPYKQIVWFSISVKSDTRLGFYRELANSWNSLFLQHSINDKPPISKDVINNKSGDVIFDQFLTSAINHNIGLIHFDEIQNLFEAKTRSIKHTQSKTSISVKESALLGKILGLLNTGIPTLITCTPDGTRGLDRTGSVIQRLGSNFLKMEYLNPDNKRSRRFVEKLFEFQYTDETIELTDEIYEEIIYLSAGVPRLIVNIFIDAQKIALRSAKAKIEIKDMRHVVNQFSPTLKKLIQAIHNNDREVLDYLTDF